MNPQAPASDAPAAPAEAAPVAPAISAPTAPAVSSEAAPTAPAPEAVSTTETVSTTEQAVPTAGQTSGKSGMDYTMVMLLLLFAILYFVMIRPQQRKEKERRAQIEALRAGARVLFCGGMIGTIEEVKKEGTFLVRVSEGTVVEIARGAVERPLPATPKA